jgi:hypothetical protein
VHRQIHEAPRTRRSARPQSRTLDIGMAVHTDSVAVAYVAQGHDAEVLYLGTIGTRHADIDQLLRTLPSKAQHLVFV